jgi:hypothetical protein
MEFAIAVALGILGALLLVIGWRTWQRLIQRAGELASEEAGVPAVPEARGPVGPDGLVCLFAHQFVRPATKTGGRDRAFAVLTDQELDPEDFALQLLYAVMTELFREGLLDFRITEREPGYQPPFPNKAWELQVQQLGEFPPSPLANAMSVAFDMIVGKRRRRRRRNDHSEDMWVSLDDLVDRMLRAIRQELSFWERIGVYGDLRIYVENALVAQGYLLRPTQATWLDRVRQKRRRPNLEAVERLAQEARELRERLVLFRREYGSPQAVADLGPEGPLPIQQVDPELMHPERSLGELPLDDCLRASLYEVLTALRQLEPSGDAGV